MAIAPFVPASQECLGGKNILPLICMSIPPGKLTNNLPSLGKNLEILNLRKFWLILKEAPQAIPISWTTLPVFSLPLRILLNYYAATQLSASLLSRLRTSAQPIAHGCFS